MMIEKSRPLQKFLKESTKAQNNLTQTSNIY